MPHPEDLIGLAAVLMIFGTPIVAILTAHQRKMAQIIHENQRNQLPNPETQALREEIRELRSLVHQQAIAMDNIANRLAPSKRAEEPRLEERI